MHCVEPACATVCPTRALEKTAAGPVIYHGERCLGCRYCMLSCPFDVPKFAVNTRRVYKCTLCADRVGVGLQPACVKACPTSCLQFGTKDDMLEVATRRVEQLKANGFPDAAVYDPPGVGGAPRNAGRPC